jgi:hypothetical protein
MIQMPKRSVTRFFIPLIDVMTLLFCIFLIMPLGQANEDALKKELAAKEKDLERIRTNKGDTQALLEDIDKLRSQLRQADRFPPTRVLEIDGKTGRLRYYDSDDAVVIRNAKDAKALVERDRRDPVAGKGDLYYLILYPRDRLSEHPLVSELDDYARWFEGVRLKYDIPGRGLIRGPSQ